MNQNLSKILTMDYLSFTVPYSSGRLWAVLKELEGKVPEENDFGGMGYTRSFFVLDGGRVFYHPERSEMGIHVRLSSSSLALLGFTPLGILNRILDWGGRFTRIDLAFDDFGGLLDIDEMYTKLLDRDVQTRYTRFTRIEGESLLEDAREGLTVNVGSRKSNSFIRIYDKLLEQQARGRDVAEIDHWVRVEVELKGEKANEAGKILAEIAVGEGEVSAGEWCAGLLLGLLDFKDRVETDDNKSRWPTSEFWLTFVGGVKKQTIRIPKDRKTLEDVKEWISSQVGPSLAMVILSLPSDEGESGYDFIMNCVRDGQDRLSKAQQLRLDLYNKERLREAEG